MLRALWPVVMPALHAFDPEDGHRAAIATLEWLPRRRAPTCDPRLAVAAFGLEFPNPLGLAAGFDKDARIPDAMLGLGFGFVEIGSITPKPQPGNDRPRMFRLRQDRAVINRLGFNSQGADAVRLRMAIRKKRPGIVGVNVGANQTSVDKAGDYVEGVRALAPFASYFAINVSSPNTAGLRKLQARAALEELVLRVVEERDIATLRHNPRRPVILKIAPDLSLSEIDDVVAVALRRGLDGLIVSNTTITRPATLRSRHAGESGGLSGPPLFRRSTWALAETYRRIEGRMPIIGVGGISSGADALAKIRAGATLVQLYTALAYQGPGLVRRILADLSEALDRETLESLTQLTGVDAEAVASAGP